MKLFFSFCKNIICESNFNTNNIKDMNGMFSNCSSLTSVNTNDGRILKERKVNLFIFNFFFF